MDRPADEDIGYQGMIGGRCALFCVALGSPQQLDESAVRRIARTVVLANYIGHDSLEKIGWCYWTQGIYNSWKQGQAAFTNHVTAVQFSHIDPSLSPRQPRHLQSFCSHFSCKS